MNLTETNLPLSLVWAEENTEDPADLSAGSARKVWWKCQTDPTHRWIKQVSEYIRYPSCPYCTLIAKGNITVGINDLATLYPLLAQQWSERNAYGPQYYSPTSSAKVFWKDVETKVAISTRVAQINQANRLVPLSTTHPNLAKLVLPHSAYSADEVSAGSKKDGTFGCEQGHEWTTTFFDFTKRDGQCPYCAGRKVLPGFNDLATTHPQLVKEWNDCDSDPTQYKANSYTEVEWKCQLGHVWRAYISARANGNACPVCAGKQLLSGFNDLATAFPDVKRIWSSNNSLSPEEVIAGSEQRFLVVCENDDSHEWDLPAYVIARGSRSKRTFICDRCSSSSGEHELANYVASLVGEDELVRHSRSIIAPYELDIYIPSKKIAVEYNGLYWHSEAAGKDASYHYNKWQACERLGIQLIQVWEDDWRDRSEVVRSMLAHKLGAAQSRKVNARACKLAEINPTDSQAFLDAHHIQGYVRGNRYLGLKENSSGELVAILGYSLTRDSNNLLTASINRFATAATVRGGFSKLMTAMLRINPQIAQVVSFASNEVSDGGLYERNGFVMEEVIPPDYGYIYKGSRHHKFSFRRARFSKDPELVYDEDLSETEMAALNGLHRFWDCGKKRYVFRP